MAKTKQQEMSEQARAARRAYKKKWNEEHRDHCRKYQREYWERKAAELQAGTKKV